MTTITKERIELFIKNPLENGLTRGEQMELARIALASLEREQIRHEHAKWSDATFGCVGPIGPLKHKRLYVVLIYFLFIIIKH